MKKITPFLSALFFLLVVFSANSYADNNQWGNDNNSNLSVFNNGGASFDYMKSSNTALFDELHLSSLSSDPIVYRGFSDGDEEPDLPPGGGRTENPGSFNDGPIGDGLWVLLLFAVAYIGVKTRKRFSIKS